MPLTTTTTTKTTTTTDKAAATAAAQLVHEKSFLNKNDADTYLTRLDKELPWDDNYSWIPDTKPLKQLVYYYDVEERTLRPNPLLEELVQLVEQTYNTKSVVTWCNKFRDSNDKIDWHQDQYGMSLYVLSFGASRPVEIRPKHNAWLESPKETTHVLNLQHGDLYHWTNEFDQQHEHRVPAVAATGAVNGPRISILVLGYPIGSNADPEKFQSKGMDPVYTGQCTKCQSFLAPAKNTLTDTQRKCKGCGKKYSYYSWTGE